MGVFTKWISNSQKIINQYDSIKNDIITKTIELQKLQILSENLQKELYSLGKNASDKDINEIPNGLDKKIAYINRDIKSLIEDLKRSL